MEYVTGVEDALGLPEVEHVELVVQGLLDTVGGHESYGLTAAQEYLQACLVAAGVFRAREVAGNEGFVGTVTDGLKKAWDYIVNLFKSIYNSVFKKKVKDRQEEVKQEIKKTDTVIKKAETKPSNDEETQRILKAFWKRVDQVNEKDRKEKLNQELEKVKKQSPAEQAASIPKMVNEMFQATVKDNEKLRQNSERIKEAVTKLKQIQATYEKTEDRGDMAGTIQRYVNGLIGLPGVDTITDLASAKAFLNKLSRCQEAMANTYMEIFNYQVSVQKKIDDINAQMNHWDGYNKANKESMAKIKELKELLQSIKHVDEQTTPITLGMSNIAVTLRKCIIVTE